MKRFALHDLTSMCPDEPSAILDGESREAVAAETIEANRATWEPEFGYLPMLGVDFDLREVP